MSESVIIARSTDDCMPVGTVVPASMQHPDGVVVLPMGEPYDPVEYDELAVYLLVYWDIEPGVLPTALRRWLG